MAQYQAVSISDVPSRGANGKETYIYPTDQLTEGGEGYTPITVSTQSLSNFTIDTVSNTWTYTGSGKTNQTQGTVNLTITAYKNSTSSTQQTWHVITVGASKCINRHCTANTQNQPQ